MQSLVSQTSAAFFRTWVPFLRWVFLSIMRVILLRNYRLIVALRIFDVLKTNVYPRSESSRENMLVLRASKFQVTIIRPIFPRHKHCIVFIGHHYVFFRASVEKPRWSIFTFLDKKLEVKCKICKRNRTKTHKVQVNQYLFVRTACLRKHFRGLTSYC